MPEPEPIPEIRDIPPPPEVADPLGVWVWFTAAGVILALIALFVWLRFRPKRPPPAKPPADQVKLALDRLHQLKQQQAETAPGEFADGVSAAVRAVLAQRFGEPCLSLTSAEFQRSYDSQLRQQFDNGHREQLLELLDTCDRMRFAPMPDDADLRSPLAESALAFVRDLPPAQVPTDADPAAA